MHSSTVKRKRLVSPVGLLSIAGVFLAAFLLLKSGLISFGNQQVTRSAPKTIAENEAADAPDPLELAYLKVHKASGEIADSEIGDVLISLLQTGRTEEAQQLLTAHPDLDLEASQRLIIDLEIARSESPVALAAALTDLVNSPLIHEPPLLLRAIELTRTLSQPQLTIQLFDKLAMHEAVEPARVFQDCGRFMQGAGYTQRAASCYRKALQITDDPDLIFELKAALVPLVEADSHEQTELVQFFLDEDVGSDQQLEELAPALLAVEQPQAAYRLYARLAMRQPDKATHWLPLAARWAEAANRPVDAAVFLDALARLLPDTDRLAVFRRVEKLLLSAGRSREVYRRVKQRLAQGSSDITELQHAVELAMHMGEIDDAMQWNGQIMALEPDNVEVRELQIDLALGQSKLKDAMRLAQELVQLQPHDPANRERLAQISEWNSDHQAANEQWQWLASTANQMDEGSRQRALEHVVRLSRQLFNPRAAADALRELTLLNQPDNDQITELVRLYVQDGQPRLASVALNDLNVVHGPSAFVTRSLAEHEYRYGNYKRSLAAWNQFERHFGSNTESTLMRVELLWRLDDRAQAALVAAELQGKTLLSQASDYQHRLLAEIGWQNRQDWLLDLSRPHIASLENRDMRVRYGRRSVATLREQGQNRKAIEESIRLWSSTGQQDFAITAMQLALKVGDQQVLQQFTPEQLTSDGLQDQPAYWVQMAASQLRQGNTDGARKAYSRALELNPEFTEAIAGLLWMDIGAADSQALHQTLERYRQFATTSPSLWQAMAVGYLQLGAASTSVQWFENTLEQIKTDYGMLLTYADALEYAGRAADALKVREYTLQQLRPVLVSGTQQEQDLILRQYAGLSARYAGAAETEVLVDYLLEQPGNGQFASMDESMWREDIAISWLMATQRLEQARVLMANMHSKRLQAPAWQRLAVALKENDKETLQAMIDASGPLSVGNHILALRQLGNDREAYAMAQVTLDNQPGGRLVQPGDIRIASAQYPYLRQVMPSFVSGGVSSRKYQDLSMAEYGFSVRHTLPGSSLGLGLQARQRTIDTPRYILNDVDQLSDVALSLFYGNGQRGGSITAGLLSAGDEQVGQGSTRWYQRNTDGTRQFDVELAYNEFADQSSELVVAGLQHRASVSLDAQLGKLPFVRLQADATRINTRENEQFLADGLGGQAEFGVRGSTGAHAWSASVQAGQVTYSRADILPPELQLTKDSTLDSVLAGETQVLALSASFGRGAVDSTFPTVGSPRYYLGARLGYYWPKEELGFHFNASLGMRVLGGDELSFTLKHDTSAEGIRENDSTGLGINYRYHF